MYLDFFVIINRVTKDGKSLIFKVIYSMYQKSIKSFEKISSSKNIFLVAEL